MTKSLLISIQPQHFLNILNGDKTYEVRKVVPKWVLEKLDRGETVEAYLYCTKGKPYLYTSYATNEDGYTYIDGYGLTSLSYEPRILNGLIPVKVVIDGYHYITYGNLSPNEYGFVEKCDTYFPKNVDWVLKDMCLSQKELNNYGNGKDLYALHISKVEILDEVMGLGDFHRKARLGEVVTHNQYTLFDRGETFIKIERPPVSMMSVWVK